MSTLADIPKDVVGKLVAGVVATVLLILLGWFIYYSGVKQGESNMVKVDRERERQENEIKDKMALVVREEVGKFINAQKSLQDKNAKLKGQFKDETAANCPKVDPSSPALLLGSEQLRILDSAFGLSGSDSKGTTSGVQKPSK